MASKKVKKAICPVELLARLIVAKATEQGIDIKKYRYSQMSLVQDNCEEVDHWIIPSVDSDKHFLRVFISKDSEGVFRFAFIEI